VREIPSSREHLESSTAASIGAAEKTRGRRSGKTKKGDEEGGAGGGGQKGRQTLGVGDGSED